PPAEHDATLNLDSCHFWHAARRGSITLSAPFIARVESPCHGCACTSPGFRISYSRICPTASADSGSDFVAAGRGVHLRFRSAVLPDAPRNWLSIDAKGSNSEPEVGVARGRQPL